MLPNRRKLWLPVIAAALTIFCFCAYYRLAVIEPFYQTKSSIRASLRDSQRNHAAAQPLLDGLRRRGFRVKKFQGASTDPKDTRKPVGDYWFKSDEVWRAELYPPGLLIGVSGVSIFLVFGPDQRLREFRVWDLTVNFI